MRKGTYGAPLASLKRTIRTVVGELSGSMKEHSDVNSGMTPTDGQVLTYDNDNTQWTSSDAAGGSTKDYAHFYLSGTGITAVSTTALTMVIDGTGEVSNSLASVTTNEITIAKTGIFKFDCNVYFNSGGTSRSEYSKYLEVDTGGGYAEVTGTRFVTYQRGYDSGGSASLTTILDVTTGDKFRLRVINTDGTGTTGYQDANGTSITIVEL